MASVTVQAPNAVNWLVKPALYCVAASLLMALPVKVFGLQPPEPVFAMVPAFAWASIRPSILPPFVLVALGLFQDELWGGPAGLWPLCLLSVHALAFSTRRALAAESFPVLWVWVRRGLRPGLRQPAFFLVSPGRRRGPKPSGRRSAQFAATAALFPASWLLVERYEDADVRFH